MPSLQQAGSIDRLEIENFKSYKGHQVIGPFKNFTAIIGPNGAGKSNLMDAISFVLGVRSMQLRGSQLKDLIYALDDRERELKGRSGSVKLVYKYSSGDELVLARTITPAGSSDYRIDGRVATWEEYNAMMKSLGILVKARNFLVFQGDVESIASKNPRELTTLFEQISGSEDIKKDYEQLEEEKQRADENAAFVYQKRRAVAAERKQKKEQKEEAEKHLQLQEDLKGVKTEHYLWQLFNFDKEMKAATRQLQELKLEFAEVSKASEGFEERMQERKRQQAVHNKEVASWERKMGKKNGEVEKMKPELVKLKEGTKHCNKKIQEAEKDVKKKQEEHEKQLKDVEVFQRHLLDVTGQLQALGEQRQDGAGKLQLAEDQMAEYRKKKEEAGTKTAKLRQDLEALSREQRSELESLATYETEWQQSEARQEELQQKITRDEQTKTTKVNDLEKLRAELRQADSDEAKARQAYTKSCSRKDLFSSKLADIERQLVDLKADKRESERDIKAAQNVANMKRLFSGVHGRMSELCRPREKRYNLAISIVMGKSFDAVVVDDEQTAKDCIAVSRRWWTKDPVLTWHLHGLIKDPCSNAYASHCKQDRLSLHS